MPRSVAQRVGSAVRAEMARRHRFQAELGAHLGMSQVSVSRRINGQVPFNVDELERVAEWLGTTTDVLLADAPAKAAS